MKADPETAGHWAVIIVITLFALLFMAFLATKLLLMYREDSQKQECRMSGRAVRLDGEKGEWHCAAPLTERAP